MKKTEPTFEVFPSTLHADHWHWRLRAANGEIVAQGEGFTRKASATRAVLAVKRAVRRIDAIADERAGIEWLPAIKGTKRNAAKRLKERGR